MRKNWVMHEETFLRREIGHEVLFLNTVTDEYFTANRLGARVVRGILDDQTESEIVSEIAAAYPAILQEQIARDVSAFLRSLEEANILQRRS